MIAIVLYIELLTNDTKQVFFETGKWTKYYLQNGWAKGGDVILKKDKPKVYNIPRGAREKIENWASKNGLEIDELPMEAVFEIHRENYLCAYESIREGVKVDEIGRGDMINKNLINDNTLSVIERHIRESDELQTCGARFARFNWSNEGMINVDYITNDKDVSYSISYAGIIL